MDRVGLHFSVPPHPPNLGRTVFLALDRNVTTTFRKEITIQFKDLVFFHQGKQNITLCKWLSSKMVTVCLAVSSVTSLVDPVCVLVLHHCISTPRCYSISHADGMVFGKTLGKHRKHYTEWLSRQLQQGRVIKCAVLDVSHVLDITLGLSLDRHD